MAYRIGVTPEFMRDYKKLSRALQNRLKQKGKIFAENPFHPIVRTHALSGKLHGQWSFSVDVRHCVIFEIVDSTKILFHRVGDHSIYRKK